MTRLDGRRRDEIRPTTIEVGVQSYAEGSTLIAMGDTRVLCAVSVEDRVPRFLRGSGRGWVTAEYAMLPRSTHTRTRRETTPRGRTQEIQRLIGRSLRAAVDMNRLGERTLTVDCDVLQADGGTRTAAITGAYVALYQALAAMRDSGDIDAVPVKMGVAAVSVGVVDGEALLDLPYEEDHRAEVDFNVVMTDAGEFIEVQGTAEDGVFSRARLDELLSPRGSRDSATVGDTARRNRGHIGLKPCVGYNVDMSVHDLTRGPPSAAARPSRATSDWLLLSRSRRVATPLASSLSPIMTAWVAPTREA